MRLWPTNLRRRVELITVVYAALLLWRGLSLPGHGAVKIEGYEQGLMLGALAWVGTIVDGPEARDSEGKVINSATDLNDFDGWFVGLSMLFGVFYGAVLFHDFGLQPLGALVLLEVMALGSYSVTGQWFNLYVALGVLLAPAMLVLFMAGLFLKGVSDGIKHHTGALTDDEKRWRRERKEARDSYPWQGYKVPDYLKEE